MKYKVTIQLDIDTADYDALVDVPDLEEIVHSEITDLLRTDILSACKVEEVGRRGRIMSDLFDNVIDQDVLDTLSITELVSLSKQFDELKLVAKLVEEVK